MNADRHQTLEELYKERDHLRKVAEVRESRSQEFMAKAMSEMDRSATLNRKADDVEAEIQSRINGRVMAYNATKSEQVKEALAE
jgi:hypothetical protein